MAKKENKVNIENLKNKMKLQMQAFNNESAEITDAIIHEETLSTTDGYKNIAPSASQYKDFVTWWVLRNGGNKFKWMAGWLKLSISNVADNIISQQKYPTI